MIKKYYSILPSEGGKGSGTLDKYEMHNKVYDEIRKNHGVYPGMDQDIWLQSMEQFARQESIEFAKWIRDNALIAEDGERWKIFGPDYNIIVNESQLYDYFTEQRNKLG